LGPAAVANIGFCRRSAVGGYFCNFLYQAFFKSRKIFLKIVVRPLRHKKFHPKQLDRK
jgi:hypothetical protein